MARKRTIATRADPAEAPKKREPSECGVNARTLDRAQRCSASGYRTLALGQDVRFIGSRVCKELRGQRMFDQSAAIRACLRARHGRGITRHERRSPIGQPRGRPDVRQL
jgi:hypothetical protein